MVEGGCLTVQDLAVLLAAIMAAIGLPVGIQFRREAKRSESENAYLRRLVDRSLRLGEGSAEGLQQAAQALKTTRTRQKS